MENKKALIAIVTVVLLAGMIIGSNLKPFDLITEEKMQEIKYNASILGYNTALNQIYIEAIKCQQALPIQFNNQTINLVAVECLNQLNNQEVK